jgi:hypothetical protein
MAAVSCSFLSPATEGLIDSKLQPESQCVIVGRSAGSSEFTKGKRPGVSLLAGRSN